jgi:hypothetical protein
MYLFSCAFEEAKGLKCHVLLIILYSLLELLSTDSSIRAKFKWEVRHQNKITT